MAWCRLRVLLTAAEVVVVVGDDSEEYWNEVFSASFGVVSEVDVVSNPNEVSVKRLSHSAAEKWLPSWISRIWGTPGTSGSASVSGMPRVFHSGCIQEVVASEVL